MAGSKLIALIGLLVVGVILIVQMAQGEYKCPALDRAGCYCGCVDRNGGGHAQVLASFGLAARTRKLLHPRGKPGMQERDRSSVRVVLTGSSATALR